MDLAIVFLVVFALGFGAGYAFRERISRNRRRRYTHAIFEPRWPVRFAPVGLACAAQYRYK
jgi:hypothetical protein